MTQERYRSGATRGGAAIAAMACALLAVSCRRQPAPPAGGPVPTPPSPLFPAFTDVTDQVGLDFVHRTGSGDDYFMPAIMAGGACVFDADGDGILDLLLVDSGEPSSGSPPATRPPRLYRGQEDWSYVDVTEVAGLGRTVPGYGMGCATADVDNDGDTDLFLTAWGRDTLYRNRGDGTFVDTTSDSGLGDTGWSTSAAFVDYDRDGLLDLYVCRYVDFDPTRVCTQEGGRRDYCGPIVFSGVDDLLYHNEGNGRFRDTSLAAGITGVADAGLGVVAGDFDDDGWLDLYVANDADPNNLWINQRDGTFFDEAVLLGTAFNRYGAGEAGMGVATGDVDDDGDLDLFVSHLIEETNTCYRNLGQRGFEDATAELGLGLPSMDYTGFGTSLFDADNDGDLDLAVVNGAVKRRPSALADRPEWLWNDYAEPNHLLANVDGSFVDVSATAGADWKRIEVSRGLVPADFDRDGDLDLLITNIEGPARLLRNDSNGGSHWLRVRLLDPELSREALGAKLVVHTPTGPLTRFALPIGGYLTGSDATIHLGLGTTSSVERYTVRWPDGTTESFPGGAVDRTVELRRGAGRSS